MTLNQKNGPRSSYLAYFKEEKSIFSTVYHISM